MCSGRRGRQRSSRSCKVPGSSACACVPSERLPIGGGNTCRIRDALKARHTLLRLAPGALPGTTRCLRGEAPGPIPETHAAPRLRLTS